MTGAKPPAAAPTDSWKSPTPYVFGGLAVMLGLISFALLVLVCSYWKLSSYLDGEVADPGYGGNGVEETELKPASGLEEQAVVIMPGDDKKLFLANPIKSRASSSTAGEGLDDAVNVSGGDATHSHS